jgi:hypothetical protein
MFFKIAYLDVCLLATIIAKAQKQTTGASTSLVIKSMQLVRDGSYISIKMMRLRKTGVFTSNENFRKFC